MVEISRHFGQSKNGILKNENGAERGLCELAIKELFDLMKPDREILFRDIRVAQGFRKRTWRGTKLNSQSSRSHRLLDFKLKGEAANGETIHGCLQMVDLDLAGSKKLDVPTRESNSIRSGLLFLDMVIEALSTNQQHIPYNSHTHTRSLEASLGKDTNGFSNYYYYLEASLGGKSKVVVLAHVSGPEKFFNKTMNTLRFANKTRKVQNGVIETLDKDLRTIQKIVQMSRLEHAVVDDAGEDDGTEKKKGAQDEASACR
ncbi:kinesin-like protein KIN-14L [Tanacetum coccineum]